MGPNRQGWIKREGVKSPDGAGTIEPAEVVRSSINESNFKRKRRGCVNSYGDALWNIQRARAVRRPVLSDPWVIMMTCEGGGRFGLGQERPKGGGEQELKEGAQSTLQATPRHGVGMLMQAHCHEKVQETVLVIPSIRRGDRVAERMLNYHKEL